MTELNKKYRLTSMEEPTDEMLQELMEDMMNAARESSAKAKTELQRRLSETAQIIAKRRSQRILVNDD
jgi:ribosomal protein L18E